MEIVVNHVAGAQWGSDQPFGKRKSESIPAKLPVIRGFQELYLP